MLLMLAEVLKWEHVAKALPNNVFLAFMAYHQTHVEWEGCCLHDLIQPSFSFLVGVAVPFSIASRKAKGQSTPQMVRHAFGRALILILLGIFLRSLNYEQTFFTFEDTLTQIGLGYGFLFLLGLRSWKVQATALGVILVGYWLAFVFTPASSFAAHWFKADNFATRFDQWFLNLFPREEPFVKNNGGYSTLSCIPTLGTMILGLLASHVLRSEWPVRKKLTMLLAAGIALLIVGSILGWTGICPVVKRIWTPSWVIFSGGWCVLLLAGFYGAVDVLGKTKPVFPLVVIGQNSIAAYCLSWLVAEPVEKALHRHFGHGLFEIFGKPYEPLLHGGATLAVLWLILYWMYKRQIFLRI